MADLTLAVPPFVAEKELCKSLQRQEGQVQALPPALNKLPGQPAVGLSSDEVLQYLDRDLPTPDLDRMSRHLWLLATPKHSHISPLHDQIVRGRQIVVSENPELHLVWIHSRVFVKPLPPFLLSHVFWAHYLTQPHDDNAKDGETRGRPARAGLGYLRTWAYLIQHESDYLIATGKHLIPEGVSYHDLASLLEDVRDRVTDDQVSGRYRFGELRLSRLNLWAPLFLFKPQFHKVVWQYSDYFAIYYGPLLFLFAVLSVVLSAMQLGVDASPDGWEAFKIASARFSVATLCLVLLVAAYLVVDFLSMAGREIVYAFRKRLRRKRVSHIAQAGFKSN